MSYFLDRLYVTKADVEQWLSGINQAEVMLIEGYIRMKEKELDIMIPVGLMGIFTLYYSPSFENAKDLETFLNETRSTRLAF